MRRWFVILSALLLAIAPQSRADVSIGGPIVRADFQPDYPLIVIRVVAEENCAYLPGREAIAGHGIDPAKLVPYAIVEAKAPAPSHEQAEGADRKPHDHRRGVMTVRPQGASAGATPWTTP